MAEPVVGVGLFTWRWVTVSPIRLLLSFQAIDSQELNVVPEEFFTIRFVVRSASSKACSMVEPLGSQRAPDVVAVGEGLEGRGLVCSRQQLTTK